WLLSSGSGTWAQILSVPAPSPLAPGDLKHPIFDTTRRVYDNGRPELNSTSTIVAEVDGRAITLGDVRDAIAALPPSMKSAPFDEVYPGILHRLIAQQALIIQAQRQKLDEDPKVRRMVKEASDQV